MFVPDEFFWPVYRRTRQALFVVVCRSAIQGQPLANVFEKVAHAIRLLGVRLSVPASFLAPCLRFLVLSPLWVRTELPDQPFVRRDEPKLQVRGRD